jgi:DNA repair protein RecN (Recombination protein N)
MLRRLLIRDFVIVQELELEFAAGMTVLTGETGTGKTMVVTGLHLLGGARADASRIRAGTDRAAVEGGWRCRVSNAFEGAQFEAPLRFSLKD